MTAISLTGTETEWLVLGQASRNAASGSFQLTSGSAGGGGAGGAFYTGSALQLDGLTVSCTYTDTASNGDADGVAIAILSPYLIPQLGDSGGGGIGFEGLPGYAMRDETYTNAANKGYFVESSVYAPNPTGNATTTAFASLTAVNTAAGLSGAHTWKTSFVKNADGTYSITFNVDGTDIFSPTTVPATIAVAATSTQIGAVPFNDGCMLAFLAGTGGYQSIYSITGLTVTGTAVARPLGPNITIPNLSLPKVAGLPVLPVKQPSVPKVNFNSGGGSASAPAAPVKTTGQLWPV